jgi:hypothetical protein
VWAGAPLDIHYAHPHNRLLAGNLHFVEIPATLDPESRHWGGKHPQDLRVELCDAKTHWYTVNKALERQRTSDTPLKIIQATTHNTFDFSAPGNFRRETLLGIIDAVRSLVAVGSTGGIMTAGRFGYALRPATTAAIAAA